MIYIVMDTIAVLGAAAVFILSVDRMFQMSWKRNKWPFVLAHFAFAVWAVGITDAVLFRGGIVWYQLSGMVAALCYFWVSWHAWHAGPPLYSFKRNGRDLSSDEYRHVSGGTHRGLY